VEREESGMQRLAGRTVLITGAARGQGEAEARLFVSEGASVVLGDVLDTPGKAVADALGPAALYVHHDVSDPANWRAFIDAALRRFGRIDALVNNAGIMIYKPMEEMTLEEYRAVIDINQVGCFLGMKAVLPAMRDAGGGAIVNVSSSAGLRGFAKGIGYVSSKFAMRGLTRTAAIELGPLGIRVNSLHPGGVDTALGWGYADVDVEKLYQGTPLGRIGQPIEMARMALFLISDESSYCTGAEFVADGGLLA
jgi:3alpha(or 20beta)-hydroxysteroid dehydrogenase